MIVEAALTGMTAIGMGLYYWPEIKAALEFGKRKINLYMAGFKRFELEKGENADRTKPIDVLSRLIYTTLGLGGKKITYGFIAVSVCMAAGVFFALRKHISPILLNGVTVFVLVLPMLVLICRLKALRVKASKEGEILLTELLDNYKINYYNMNQAIDVTALTIKEAPGCKKLLFNLSKGLNTISQPSEIRSLLKDLEFGIGTSWSAVLADNMYFALVSGIRVTAAMEDLAETVSKARKVSEYAKRENNEGGLILKYMVPCCYALTVAAAIKYFGLSFEEYIHYQFMTSAGMGWFMVSLMTYLSGIFLRVFLSKSKLDL